MSSPERPSKTASATSDALQRGAGSAVPLHCDGVVLRTPLLPVETMLQWSKGTTAAEAWASGGDLARALAADRLLLRAGLAALVRAPHVNEALHLASPAVAAGIEAWFAEPDTKQGRDLERTLTRYAIRMSTRATPFGLFSGCSVGTVGERTEAVLAPQSAYRRSLELDADAVVAMATRLSASEDGWQRARLHTNTTVAEVAGGFHYAEWRDGDGGRSYDLARLPDTPALRSVLTVARAGASVDELVAVLQQQVADLGADEAMEFLGELVTNKVLTSELEPPVTGVSPSEALARTLMTTHPEHAATLRCVRDRFDALEQRPLGASASEYTEIRGELGALLDEGHRHWLHCVLRKPAERLTLGRDVLSQLAAVIAALDRLATPSRALRDFTAAFRTRYDERFVSLVEALDPDAGIAFGATGRDATPLLDGLLLGNAAVTSTTVGPFEQRLGALLARRAGVADLELSIDDTMLAALTEGLAAPAEVTEARAFAAMFSLAEPRTPGDAPEVVLNAITGPSGAALLGRFCHGDPATEALTRAHTRGEEQDADVAFAEIAHSPEGRLANVIARPVLREYEIAYLGRSGAPEDRRIHVDDLEVGIRQGRVVLRSRRLGREVVPRLTCAHNAGGSSLPIYRFLTAIAGQDAPAQVAWRWGSALANMFEFLPRVRIADVVVSLARWSCRREEVEGLESPDEVVRFAAVQALRQRRGLPRWVSHGFADRLVVIDLDNSLAIDALGHAVRGQPRFELTEVYPDPSRQLVRGPEGRYVAELIAPMLRRGGPRSRRAEPSIGPSVARSFAPGSEWLYARLYTSPAGADRLIHEVVAPMMRRFADDRAIERWFFIRYADPEWHLRVRVHGDRQRLQHEVLPTLLQLARCTPAIEACWKTELGTYEREVERYGGPAGIELAETIFHLDSLHAIESLRAIGRDADLRWRACLAGIDATLAGLGLGLESRLEVMLLACASLAPEYSLGKITDNQLGQRFRTERAIIAAVLGDDAVAQLGEPVVGALHSLRAGLQPVGDALRELERGSRLTAPIHAIAGSLVHMHANRMLRADARAQEYVLYDYLRRHYRAALGRARRGPAPRP